MNDRKRYYPVVVYTVLLLLVWVVSLATDLLQLFYGNTVWGNSLISAGGVRWAVRNALPSIAAAPWSVVVVSLAIVGLLRSSGIAAMLSHLLFRFRLSKNLWVASEGSQALRFYIENRRHVRRFSRDFAEAG